MSADRYVQAVVLLLSAEVCVLSKYNITLPVSPNLRKNEPDITKVIRFNFSRRGALIYIAHLDMLRLFERALIRSGLKFVSSQGFNPRPLMVFALPVGIGVEVDNDLVEITFYGGPDTEQAADKLNASMPPDIRITNAHYEDRASGSIMAMVNSAEYTFMHKDLSRSVRTAMSGEVLNVTKGSKGKGGKVKDVDIKPLIHKLDFPDDNTIKAVFSAGSKNNLRPDLFLKALTTDSGFSLKNALDTVIIRNRIFLEGDHQVAEK
ncbi:MAG: TIGR03936 family radical SAM-associated protein [Eubacteriales bacterium]|nr:TIGR03936 family radical SAM-associated protein [Eubacteriales bacterium]